MSYRDAPEFDVEEYRSPPEFGGTGIPLVGPGLVQGALLLGMCVLAAVLLNGVSVVGSIAIANAVAHLVFGMAWTIRSVDSIPKHKVKLVGILLWGVTILVGALLLVLSFFV